MKNIKHFKYINTKKFIIFLNEYKYKLDDVKGFNVSSIHRYNGNIFKTYIIYFNDGEYLYFKVVYFKSFNEFRQSAFGFNGDKLWNWYQNANIRMYK